MQGRSGFSTGHPGPAREVWQGVGGCALGKGERRWLAGVRWLAGGWWSFGVQHWKGSSWIQGMGTHGLHRDHPEQAMHQHPPSEVLVLCTLPWKRAHACMQECPCACAAPCLSSPTVMGPPTDTPEPSSQTEPGRGPPPPPPPPPLRRPMAWRWRQWRLRRPEPNLVLVRMRG